ncbi:hypothetical protein [Candidatus Methanodesulfokora washburnensis]|jgi:hypothetical protein|uniref:Uncharacterized protein n=1 Tax=Candidatus Methanodesulfokora washburnensis TaxID=2478471 RepID=A0A3R9PTB7_9CREN|nr:hypothetical protein [Candidatus Methanodesulfokores washburnensis]RSN72488.1 hypothetical protein D6D85_13645 [Candidatus Methanodesulfokores washburnensis]
MEEHKLLIFHERELEKVLSKLNLTEKIEKGELKCSICGKIITKENFGGILGRNGNILVICDSIECIEKAGGE